jgi:hypothetical protein
VKGGRQGGLREERGTGQARKQAGCRVGVKHFVNMKWEVLRKRYVGGE